MTSYLGSVVAMALSVRLAHEGVASRKQAMLCFYSGFLDFGADLCLRQRPSAAVSDGMCGSFFDWFYIAFFSSPFGCLFRSPVYISSGLWTLAAWLCILPQSSMLFIGMTSDSHGWLGRLLLVTACGFPPASGLAQRLMRAWCHSSQLIRSSYSSLGCVNACSVGNKSSLLCRSLEERQFDVLVVVETWHECSESVTLKRIVPPGFQSVDAARSTDTTRCTLTLFRITVAWHLFVVRPQ